MQSFKKNWMKTLKRFVMRSKSHAKEEVHFFVFVQVIVLFRMSFAHLCLCFFHRLSQVAPLQSLLLPSTMFFPSSQTLLAMPKAPTWSRKVTPLDPPLQLLPVQVFLLVQLLKIQVTNLVDRRNINMSNLPVIKIYQF